MSGRMIFLVGLTCSVFISQYMANRTFQTALFIYLAVIIALYATSDSPQANKLRIINDRTAVLLSELVQTKYFRILRLNLNSECPLPIMNELCRSKSCSVCRCDEKDIPQMWIKTDKVKSTNPDLDVWSQERPDTNDWLWHVEDEDNDKGEYFDVYSNVESFSGYNGSYIWKLIYEENCFGGYNKYQSMCLEEKVLYNIISGLHTSISSHLSRLHKNTTKTVEWADRGEETLYFNHQSYESRVLSHPDRINNMLFLYEILMRAVQQITPYLEKNRIVQTENIAEDLQTSKLLDQLIRQVKSVRFQPLNETDAYFFEPSNPHVKQYQKYIHNISRILNCVSCEKCKLFGKMQTYGVGTALKIILGYNTQYKRNELVALFNTLNKISVSVNTYFNYQRVFKGSNESHGKNAVSPPPPSKCPFAFTFQVEGWLQIWLYCGGTLLIFLWVVSSWNGQKKVKKMFKHSFPKEESGIKSRAL